MPISFPIKLPLPFLQFPLCCLWMLLAGSAWSQPAYRPAGYAPEPLARTVDKINDRLQRDIAALPAANRVYLAAEYTERADSLKSELGTGHFLTDTLWNRWFGNVLGEITRSNPGIPGADITLLLSNYESPNAHSMGEGTLIFNVSMLPYLKNESQVAFILCHELAHYVNNHGNLALHQYVNTLHSPETQQQLKAIAKGRYNKTERALALMRAMVYNGRTHSRFKESEADSLGFVFLSRTHYRIEESITALQRLDTIDQTEWPEIPYATLFNSPAFPFQAAWLEQPARSGLSGQTAFQSEEFNEDSLKTHPDCPQRIVKTQKQLEQLDSHPAGRPFLQAEADFTQLRDWSQYEVLEGLYHGREYGRALFRTLVLMSSRPEDAYLNALTVQCLYGLCQYERNHRLREVLELPRPDYSREYNRFLRFVNQLRVSDLSRLSYHFYRDRWEKYQNHEAYQFAAVLACHLAGEKEEFATRKQGYLAAFPQGKYLPEIEKLEAP